MIDDGSLLTGGGTGGAIVALAYIAKLAWEGRREHRQEKREEVGGAVVDAATANATLVRTIETLQAENGRMAKKIRHLEDEAADKDRKIEDLTQRVNAIAAELAALKSDGH